LTRDDATAETQHLEVKNAEYHSGGHPLNTKLRKIAARTAQTTETIIIGTPCSERLVVKMTPRIKPTIGSRNVHAQPTTISGSAGSADAAVTGTTPGGS
jgi:hypothetical protein